MTKDNDIVPVSEAQAADMNAIVLKYGDSLTPEQVRALPMIGYGMSIKRTSEYLKLPYETVRLWVNTDYRFRQAVEEFRSVARTYHEAMLNQSAVFAWDRIMEYLTSDAHDPKEKIMQANVAQFVIGQLGLKTQKSEVRHEVEPQLHVTDDSADLIAKKLHQLQTGKKDEAIDAEYRIDVEDEPADSMAMAQAVDSFEGITANELDELKNPDSPKYSMHPDAVYGELTYDAETKRFLCHICGKRTLDLVVHIRTEHSLSPARYKNMYGLPPNTKFHMESVMEAPKDVVDDHLGKTE